MKKSRIPFGLPHPGGAGMRPEPIKNVFGPPPAEEGEGPEKEADAGMPAPPSAAPEAPFLPQITVGREGIQQELTDGVHLEGTVTAGSAENVLLSDTAETPCVNGIYVKDDAAYRISDAQIAFTGDGTNDFAGRGAGVQAADCAEVTIEDSKIETTGVIRPCTFVGDDAVLKVYHSELIGNGGTLQPDEPRRPGPGMRQPPEGLGIGGNCRTHLSVGNSHAYFYDSRIVADGWAALSTDACAGEDLYLEADRCDIEVRKSGYATYSDNGAFVVLNDCRVQTEISAILAGECKTHMNGCSVEARDCLAMLHSVMGNTHEIGDFTLDGGKVHTGKECICIKSQNAYLDLRGVQMRSDSGVLIHSVKNDDPFATKVPEGEEVYGIKAVLSDMQVSGAVLHEDPDREMTVRLEHTRLTGGMKNVHLAMSASSIWTADKDSQVILVPDEVKGQIDALPGVTIEAYTDSEEAPERQQQLPSGGILLVRKCR